MEKSRNEDTNTNKCMGANICPADSKMPPENFENLRKILSSINDDCSMIVTRTTRRFEKN